MEATSSEGQDDSIKECLILVSQKDTEVPPKPKPPKKNLTMLFVVMVVVVLILAFYVMTSSLGPHIGGVPPLTVGLAQYSSGSLNSSLPTTIAATWGASLSCSSSSPCQTDNFTLSASAELNTSMFGFKITTRSGSTVAGWVMVLWGYPQYPQVWSPPLAAWSQANNTWTAAHGLTLPIGGLQDDGVMLITAPGTTVIGSGDSLYAFGSGSRSVSGSTTL